VEAFGKKKISKLKEHVGSGATFWGEHFFFEKNFEVTKGKFAHLTPYLDNI